MIIKCYSHCKHNAQIKVILNDQQHFITANVVPTFPLNKSSLNQFRCVNVSSPLIDSKIIFIIVGFDKRTDFYLVHLAD